MKFLQVFMLALVCHFVVQNSFAQTATGNCNTNSITVSNIPPYPTVYFANAGFKNCSDGGGFYEGCDEGGQKACCRVITKGPTGIFPSPVTPRFWLEQLVNGSWTTVAGPQSQTIFSNLVHGTYRVKCQVPNIATNICMEQGNPNLPGTRICLFNESLQFIGYWGTWDNFPFRSTPPTYSNLVVVGATVQSDIAWNFIDANGNDLFSPEEPIRMNTTNTKNYESWWVAIFENGGQNRYWSNGWTQGLIPGNLINLTLLTGAAFQSGINPFAQIPVSYTVQFAISSSCNTQWINLDKNFAVCPAGLGCRIAENEDIRLYPNPANNSFQLYNFDTDPSKQQRIVLMDMNGRTVKSFEQITQSLFDISDLTNGLYVVSIWENGSRLLTTKLSVVK